METPAKTKNKKRIKEKVYRCRVFKVSSGCYKSQRLVAFAQLRSVLRSLGMDQTLG